MPKTGFLATWLLYNCLFLFQVGYENADVFYRHVDNHAHGIPEGNVIPGGCTCLWEGNPEFLIHTRL